MRMTNYSKELLSKHRITYYKIFVHIETEVNLSQIDEFLQNKCRKLHVSNKHYQQID